MSKQTASPYINFQGRAREALEFYHRVLGGELQLFAVGEKGAPRQAGPGDRISFGRLDADGVRIVGSDGHPDYPPTVGDQMAVYLAVTDDGRLTELFDGLAEGGTVKAPLTRQPWGLAGWLGDRYGVSWVVGSEQG